MRFRAAVIFAAGGILCSAVPAGAQFAATQDSTLRDLRRVYVNFEVSEGAVPGSMANRLSDGVKLELRKAGLRLANSPEELADSTDAILNLTLIKIPRSLSTDFALRMDLEQQATLQRTKQTLKMVTWYYEEDQRNVIPEQAAEPMTKKAVDRLLMAWLDNNGR
jgi:hypothetical protein